MMYDSVVEEVRRSRAEYASKFNYDVAAICGDLRRRTKKAEKAGRTVVILPPRRPPGFRASGKKSA
jgi:hypothetical protein